MSSNQQHQQGQAQQTQQHQYQQQPSQQQPEPISQAHLQQSQQQYQQHQARMQQQQRELQQAAQAQSPAAGTATNSNRYSEQPAQNAQQQALGTQALHGGQSEQSSSAQNRSSQKVPQPTVRPVKQTQPTQQQLQKPLPSQPSQPQSQQQTQQQSKEGALRAEQAHVNQQPFFRPHETASHQSRQAQQGSPVSVPARSSSIKRTGGTNTTHTTSSNHTSSHGKSGNTPMMSWLTVLGFLALGLAIFVKDPLHRRTTRVHYPKDHGGDKGQTPIGDSERLNAWKHVPVKELRVDESFWNKERPFDWPHAKRLVVFGDETVSSAAGNAHGHPNGLNEHKGLRWTDYLYKSFMDDDALYHNLATIGSTAGDIEAQIKAFQSMSAVQGSSFNSDDTLFVIGSGEEAVKPLDGSAAKAPAVTGQVNDLMKRAEQLWTAGARSFLFVGLREAGDDGRAREHWNAELGDALNKFKKAHPAANVMLFRYADWFDAVRAHPDIVGITECKREVEPHTDSARLGYCIDTFGDETWPLDRLLSHAVNGYLVKHSRAGGGRKTEASGGKQGKQGSKQGNKHRNHEHEKKKENKKSDGRRKGKMGSKSS